MTGLLYKEPDDPTPNAIPMCQPETFLQREGRAEVTTPPLPRPATEGTVCVRGTPCVEAS